MIYKYIFSQIFDNFVSRNQVQPKKRLLWERQRIGTDLRWKL